MIGRLITAIFGIAGALLPLLIGVGVSEWWEHRAAGQPSWAQVHFLWIKWEPPPSLAAQRDAAQAQMIVYRTAEARARARAVVVERQQTLVTTQAARQDDIAQAAIRWRYRTLIKEVPIHVTPAMDVHFPLSVGFVRMHDAAALGINLSGQTNSAGQSDDSPSDVVASQAITTITGNYGSCYATRQLATDLQGWIRNEGEAPK